MARWDISVPLWRVSTRSFFKEPTLIFFCLWKLHSLDIGTWLYAAFFFSENRITCCRVLVLYHHYLLYWFTRPTLFLFLLLISICSQLGIHICILHSLSIQENVLSTTTCYPTTTLLLHSLYSLLLFSLTMWLVATNLLCTCCLLLVGMKTDRIRTNIIDITFVFIFLSGFGFEYG